MIANPIDLDSEFTFHCTKCGECCKDREDILLNPFDVYRIAKGLDVETYEVLDRYTYGYIGKSSRMPIVAVKMVEDSGCCVFLKGKKCGIQDFKPGVCALYPLGRFVARDMEGDSSVSPKVSYILQPYNCGIRKDIHTPRQWLKDFHMDECEDEFILWQDIVFELSPRLAKIYDRLPHKVLDLFYDNLFGFLYINYDLEKDAAAQLESNWGYIQDMLRTVEDFLQEIG